jgi:hypothetical protein
MPKDGPAFVNDMFWTNTSSTWCFGGQASTFRPFKKLVYDDRLIRMEEEEEEGYHFLFRSWAQ